ncbi:hypothetical protein, partial [Sphingomonas koreensis]|uniref:hypothetical protein n=1 Tax=Sphingomonas koreensis TaxID=93064 RepID=UPI0019D2B444
PSAHAAAAGMASIVNARPAPAFHIILLPFRTERATQAVGPRKNRNDAVARAAGGGGQYAICAGVSHSRPAREPQGWRSEKGLASPTPGSQPDA